MQEENVLVDVVRQLVALVLHRLLLHHEPVELIGKLGHFFLALLYIELLRLDDLLHRFVGLLLPLVYLLALRVLLIQVFLVLLPLRLFLLDLLVALRNLLLDHIDFALEVLATLFSPEDGVLFHLQ